MSYVSQSMEKVVRVGIDDRVWILQWLEVRGVLVGSSCSPELPIQNTLLH